MSIMYCHEHDRSWDMDYVEECPQCIDEGLHEEEIEEMIQRGKSVSEEDLNKLWESKL